MRNSDDYTQSQIKKRQGYKDNAFYNDHKTTRIKKNRQELSRGSNPNIHWLYDYGPFKKLIAILFAASVFFGLLFYFRYEILYPEQKNENQIVIDTKTRAFSDKEQEVAKAEKISEELERIFSEKSELQPVVKSNKRNQDVDNPVYIWINKKGNKVYSNKKPVQEKIIP